MSNPEKQFSDDLFNFLANHNKIMNEIFYYDNNGKIRKRWVSSYHISDIIQSFKVKLHEDGKTPPPYNLNKLDNTRSLDIRIREAVSSRKLSAVYYERNKYFIDNKRAYALAEKNKQKTEYQQRKSKANTSPKISIHIPFTEIATLLADMKQKHLRLFTFTFPDDLTEQQIEEFSNQFENCQWQLKILSYCADTMPTSLVEKLVAKYPNAIKFIASPSEKIKQIHKLAHDV